MQYNIAHALELYRKNAVIAEKEQWMTCTEAKLAR